MRRAKASGLVLGTMLLGAACSGGQQIPDKAPVEQAEVTRIEVKDQDFTRFTAVSHVQIDPSAPVQAMEATYELVANGDVVASGTEPLSQEIMAGGGTVEVAATAPYATGEKLAQVLSSTTPVAIIMRGHVKTSDGTEWEFRRAGRVRAPRVPDVRMWHVEAGAFPQENQVGLVFFVRVENPNPFDIELEQFTYDLAINGMRLVEQGIAGTKERVPASSVAQLELPLTLSEQNFPEVGSAIRGRGGLAYDLDGVVRLPVGRIPIELAGPIELGGSAPMDQ